jgi:hypothetical protein
MDFLTGASQICMRTDLGLDRNITSDHLHHEAVFGFREIIASSFPHKKVEPLSNVVPVMKRKVSRPEAGAN